MLKTELKENMYIVNWLRQRIKILTISDKSMEVLGKTGLVKTSRLDKNILSYARVSDDQTDDYIQLDPFKL
jgi:hypothetical protein